jgi:hypothetical protein
MADSNKRRSGRVVPFVSEDELVVIHQKGKPNLPAKMIDLSEGGTLVYLLEAAEPAPLVTLSMYHKGKAFEIPATVRRNADRLVAFEFSGADPDALGEVQSKLIHMEVEWMRLSRRS